MSTEKAHSSQGDQQLGKLDQNIEWDHGEVTYGHTISDSLFKRKNSPNQSREDKNLENEKDVNKELKNINLSEHDDLASRNINSDKGLGGKSL